MAGKQIHVISYEQLKSLYTEKRLSTLKIAKQLGASPSTILRNLKKFNLFEPNRDLNYVDKEELFDLLVNKRLSQEEIGKILGVSDFIINRRIKKYGIEVSRHNKYFNNFTEGIKEQISALYINEKLTTKQISKKLKLPHSAIWKVLDDLGIKKRGKGDYAVLNISNTKVKINADGYKTVLIPVTHKFASMAMHGKKRRTTTCLILEHRLVMATHLDRPLEKWEVVHHKNHNRSDNRIENLIVTNPTDHIMETICFNELRRLKKENTELKEFILKCIPM